MSDARARALNEVIAELRRLLVKCDKAGVAATTAIHVDLAIQLAERERERDTRQAQPAQAR